MNAYREHLDIELSSLSHAAARISPELDVKKLINDAATKGETTKTSFFHTVLKSEIDCPITFDLLIAVMCDKKVRTMPAIIRAVWEMSGYWPCKEELMICLGLVREHGWSLKTSYDYTNKNLPTTYQLVKA